MKNRPLWFDACIIGGVFTLILLAGSAHVGFFTFLLNVIAVGLFTARIVVAVKDGEIG